MPSRHRIRNTSTANKATQAFLNAKAGLIASQSKSETLSSIGSLSSVVQDANNSYANNRNSSNHNNSNNILNGHLKSGNHYSGSGDGSNPQDEKRIRNAYLNTLTKEQLKIECKKRGQKQNGNRFDLLLRLGVKLSQIQKKGTVEAPINTRNTNKMETTTKKIHKKSNGTSPSGLTSHSQRDSTKTLSKEKQRAERDSLVLWRSPIQTVKFCSFEIVTLIQTYGKKLFYQQAILAGILVLIGILSIFYNVPGRHQIVIEMIRNNTWFFVYWIGLGVLSSVGLGTGLHTFLLYLGPHIASVTLAAYECNALNFPKPPYPDDIICPESPDAVVPNLWNIMSKVRLEAFLWGAGTALGELPPYFMAKAARLSGYDPEDAEDMAEFEALKRKKAEDLTILDKGKLFMEKLVERVGFFGILACASVPNPLFDLAGITCGHFLVPFWTFFGATLIGKAIIKMHIQKIFVIIAFNESLIERAVDFLELVPVFGKKLQEPFKLFLANQKTRLHRHSSGKLTESGNVLSKIFEKFVIAMVCYFVVSIINSLAQSYHKRIHKSNKKTK